MATANRPGKQLYITIKFQMDCLKDILLFGKVRIIQNLPEPIMTNQEIRRPVMSFLMRHIQIHTIMAFGQNQQKS